MSLIEWRGIEKTYGAGEATVKALAAVDLVIDRGEFTAIMGPSGSGKSTALNIIGCLDAPTRGAYCYDGVDVGALSRRQQALLRRHFLGFVFQGFNLLSRTTALENVELPLIYRGVPGRQRRDRARSALAAVGLEGREHHTPAELSGGQAQRVAIARALVSDPMLLIADEPTGNLDTARSHDLMELLVQINTARGITVVMVTHEVDMAAYATRTIHFRDGRIARDETKLARTGAPCS